LRKNKKKTHGVAAGNTRYYTRHKVPGGRDAGTATVKHTWYSRMDAILEFPYTWDFLDGNVDINEILVKELRKFLNSEVPRGTILH
jgi:hypothetical protein